MQTFILHLCALLVGMSKVGFGGGAGTLVVPLLASLVSPREALGLTLPLLLATDLMALVLYRGRWDRLQVRRLLPGALAGIALAAPGLRVLPPDTLARAIALLALLFVTEPWRWWRGIGLAFGRRREKAGAAALPDPGVATPPTRPVSAAPFFVGVASGFSSTFAHVGGMLTLLYLLPFRLPNDVFVATGSVLFCWMNIAKLGLYAGSGFISWDSLRTDLTLFPTLAVGVGVGFLLNRRLSGKTFGRVVRWMAVVASLKLLAFAR